MNKVVFAISAVLAIVSGIVFANLRPSPVLANEILVGSCLAILVVSLLPWLVLCRRRFLKTPVVASQHWARVITAFLTIGLLFGPVVTGTYKVWMNVARPTDAWGGFGPAIGFVIIAIVSHYIGFAACVIAFLIQLWRDQWKSVLNVLAIAYQVLVYLVLCVINA